MATITTIASGDGISPSRTVINTNFANLNSDKIETSVLDTDTTLAADSNLKVATQKAVKAYVDAGGNVNASETTRGIVEEATDAEVTAGTATGGTGAKLFVTPAKLTTRISSLLKFGGTGADGALTISSGTTTIDCASAAIVIKNYTSVSITGTGTLSFINPHANGTIIILKTTGNITLTSSSTPMINALGLGALGGAAVSGGGATQGNNGNDGYGLASYKTNAGQRPSSGGALPTFNPANQIINQYGAKYPWVVPGAGGASADHNAGTGSYTAKAGGIGGGGLIIECAGAWNFTTVSGISVAGAVGGNSVVDTAGNSGVGGGGGGGGGVCFVSYATLIANTGTITVSGGAGGNTATSSGSILGGGAGGSIRAVGGTGSSQSNGVKSGGDGATGYSLVVANTEFV